MSHHAVRIDSFTTLDAPSRKAGWGEREKLAALAKVGRFSVWDMDPDTQRMLRDKLIEHTGGEFPWINVKLTDKGRALLNPRPPSDSGISESKPSEVSNG